MAFRKPLVIVSGLFSELPVGDSTVGLDLAAAPSGIIYVGTKLGIDGSAQISGNAGISAAVTAQASGNVAQSTANTALASGNAALTLAASKGDVTLTGTQTLTNKTLTAPTIASANLTTALTLAGAAGTNGQVLTSAGTGLPTWATVSAGYTFGTPVNVSGSSTSITGIPATAKQIVLMFYQVKSNAAVNKFIQLGDSGGFVTTGYVTQENFLANSAASDSFTDAWRVRGDVASTTKISGAMTFTLYNASTFTYVGVGAFSYPQNDKATTLITGIVTLPSILTQIRVTVSGTTYDTGSINIAYI